MQMLDSFIHPPNINAMSDENLPAIVPSLARVFEPERQALKQSLSHDMPATQIVLAARRALDRAGAAFSKDLSDPDMTKAGLWLLEIVKSGAGILDQAADARVTWSEVAAKPARKIAGRGLFYGAAGIFALAGLLQGEFLAVGAAGILAGLRFFDPRDWGHLKYKIPFIKRPPAIEDQSGRRMLAEAHITANPQGFVDQLAEGLKTADHILLRLAEPALETHWRDDARLMTLVQSLLEAEGAGDGDFALKLIKQEMNSVLKAEGIEQVTYSKKTQHLFDVLPSIGEAGIKMAAPALMSGDQVIRRGTVWQGE